MRVRMLKNWNASEDGINVKAYTAGQVYDVPADLGGKWLVSGIAEQDKEKRHFHGKGGRK